MKSYAQDLADGTKSIVIPSGRMLPRGLREGEIFRLVADMPQPENPAVLNSWYPKGTYVCNGITWDKLNDANRQYRSGVIGAQKIEVEKAGVLSTDMIPRWNEGFQLSSVSINPSNRRATIAGIATFWVDVSNDAHVWVTVSRNHTVVGLALQHVCAGRPSTFSISFLDTPAVTTVEQPYALRVNTDIEGFLFINQCKRVSFDGMSQTTFTLNENT